ncbi:hypothetical protein STPYR_12254 [uncultured Stenotrophomonas sp.]|uniref:Uncharacterized protein n=1 Tax=uncultured Stenotrophomonas sp. TaxID=165438 RepID=A0A1Y5QB05_9GAMM|nr:hypothetical protein STPYR_12254 [uncultured Stenotrophomonas sp.]
MATKPSPQLADVGSLRPAVPKTPSLSQPLHKKCASTVFATIISRPFNQEIIMECCRMSAVILSACMVAGCGTLPQHRVFMSPHSAADADIYSLSYPAELRASTLFFGLHPDTPEETRQRISKARSEWAKKKLEYDALPSTSNQRTVVRKQMEELRKEIRLLTGGWVRPRILAEPPPDVATSLKLTVKVPVEANGKVTGEVDASTSIQQIALATESDVKRHLMYRLNEALFNEPEAILPIYQTLFTAIVNLQVPAASSGPSGVAATKEPQTGKQEGQPDTGKQRCTAPSTSTAKPPTADAATTPPCEPPK